MTVRWRANPRRRHGGAPSPLRAVFAGLLGLFAQFATGEIARASPRIASLGVGIAEKYRTDRWCPVDVRFADIDNNNTTVPFTVEITAVDPASRAVVYRGVKRLSADSENRVRQLIRLGRPTAPIVVTLRDCDDAIVAQRSFARADLAEPLDDDESLVLIAGRLSGLDGVPYAPQHEARRAVYRQLASLAELPAADWRSLTDRTLALDAVDTVVWLAGQTPAASADRHGIDLLDDWVRGGGRLILSLGPHAVESFADSKLLQRNGLAIGSESTELRQIAPLEAIIGDDAARRSASAARSDTQPFRLPIARIALRDGKVVAAAGQSDTALPLVVRVPRGFGEIVVVAFDLGDEALVAWPGHARLLSTIFSLGELDASPTPADRPATAAWTGKAYASLGEQLADALDQFPGASPSRFWYLAAAALAYLLVIGPLDWYIVRRRPEWTWATFLATVVLACVAAYVIVYATKADESLANQLTFIDVDMTSADVNPAAEPASAADAPWRIRGTASACLYQPSPAVVDVAVTPLPVWPTLATDGRGTPLTMPSATPFHPRLSLADRPTASATSAQTPSLRSDDSTPRFPASQFTANATYNAAGNISALAVAAWSTQHVDGQWSRDAALQSVASLSPDAFGRLAGKIRNPLDEPLEQTVLFYGTLALSLGTLPPGQDVAVDGRGDWRSAEAYLTRQRLNQDRQTAERYDAASFDLDRIGEVVGFYEAAGGKRYTGLDRGNLDRLDLSRQIRLGRAVLIGKARSGVAISVSPSEPTQSSDTFSNDTTAYRQTTWWRFLIRVADATSPAN